MQLQPAAAAARVRARTGAAMVLGAGAFVSSLYSLNLGLSFTFLDFNWGFCLDLAPPWQRLLSWLGNNVSNGINDFFGSAAAAAATGPTAAVLSGATAISDAVNSVVTPKTPQHAFATAAGGVAALGWGAALWNRWARADRAHLDALTALDSFLVGADLLDGAALRALRLVQEVELVSRGYRVVKGPLPPVSRLEAGSSTRTCPALRLVLYRGLVACLRTSRVATQKLLAMHPLSPGLDYDTLYLANTPLSELGVSEAVGATELRHETNGLAVAGLKSLCGLYAEQRSELARRVCLTVLPECLANVHERKHLLGLGRTDRNDDDDDVDINDDGRKAAATDSSSTSDASGNGGQQSDALGAIFAEVTELLKEQSTAMAAVVTRLDRQIMFHGGSQWEDGVAAAAAFDEGVDRQGQGLELEQEQRGSSKGSQNEGCGGGAGQNSTDCVDGRAERMKLRRAMLAESRDFLDSLGLVGQSLHTATAAAHICFSDVHELAQAVAEHSGGGLVLPRASESGTIAGEKLALLKSHYELIEATLSDAARYAASGLVGLRRVYAAAVPTTDNGADNAGGKLGNVAEVDSRDGNETSNGDDTSSSSGDGTGTGAGAAEELPEEDAEDRLFEAYTGPLEPLSPFDDDSLTPEQQKAAWKAERGARAVERARVKEEAALKRARLDSSKAVLSELRAVLSGGGMAAGGGEGGRK